MLTLPNYAVITPVKDEAIHFQRTAEALLAQTHRPLQWVVVDDGSSDGTFELAAAYALSHEWISVLRTPGTQRRERGAPIVRAFKQGLASLECRPEFVVKLDGDLFFDRSYFAWVASVFAVDAQAGVVGGIVCVPSHGSWAVERMNVRTVHGAIKSYRYACLEDIGGLDESMGWDGIDEYAARARGWKVHVLTEMRVLHYKPRGSAQPWYQARWEEGRGARYMGYRARAIILRVAYRMIVERPPVLGGLVLGAGFCWYTLQRSAQADPAARHLLGTEQAGLMRRRVCASTSVNSLPGGGPAYWLTGAEPRLPDSVSFSS